MPRKVVSARVPVYIAREQLDRANPTDNLGGPSRRCCQARLYAVRIAHLQLRRPCGALHMVGPTLELRCAILQVIEVCAS